MYINFRAALKEAVALGRDGNWRKRVGKPLSCFVSIFFYGNEIGFGKVGVGRGIGICGQIRTESQKIKLGTRNLICLPGSRI